MDMFMYSYLYMYVYVQTYIYVCMYVYMGLGFVCIYWVWLRVCVYVGRMACVYYKDVYIVLDNVLYFNVWLSTLRVISVMDGDVIAVIVSHIRNDAIMRFFNRVG